MQLLPRWKICARQFSKGKAKNKRYSIHNSIHNIVKLIHLVKINDLLIDSKCIRLVFQKNFTPFPNKCAIANQHVDRSLLFSERFFVFKVEILVTKSNMWIDLYDWCSKTFICSFIVGPLVFLSLSYLYFILILPLFYLSLSFFS